MADSKGKEGSCLHKKESINPENEFKQAKISTGTLTMHCY